MVKDIVPMIDGTFRTLADREHRAMAGLSMGGNQTCQVPLHNLDKFAYIGAFSGTVNGFNVNAANALAAFFAATGQDMAHVISSSGAFVQADAVDGGVHFMVSLPVLEVATIGGGTSGGTAKEILNLLGCGGFGKSVDDNDHVMRLAEICAVAVSALDLNTACAQAAGYEMADSHVAFARGEKE